MENSNINATKTYKVFKENKVRHSNSYESIQFCQEGVLNNSQQCDLPKIFVVAAILNTFHVENKKILDSNHIDKCISNYTPSTPHRHLDLYGLSRE